MFHFRKNIHNKQKNTFYFRTILCLEHKNVSIVIKFKIIDRIYFKVSQTQFGEFEILLKKSASLRQT